MFSSCAYRIPEDQDPLLLSSEEPHRGTTLPVWAGWRAEAARDAKVNLDRSLATFKVARRLR